MFPHFSGFLHSFHYISLLEFSWDLFFVFVYIVDYQCVLYLVRLPPPPHRNKKYDLPSLRQVVFV